MWTKYRPMKQLFIFFLIFPVSFCLQCLDTSGKPVDWFVFYKLPHLWNHPDNLPISNGTGFMYFDVNNKTWTLMKDGMDVPNNAIYHTMQQIYDLKDNTTAFYHMYNDEWPDSDVWSPSSGHCKGVAAFDSSVGFWMLHSIPKFPSTIEWRFPSNAHYYGQMGVCISYDTQKSLNDIANQLFYYNAFTYTINVPDQFINISPVLAQLRDGKYKQGTPYESVKVLQSLNGQKFRHFAKTGDFGKDLYADLVVPTLLSSMKVQTWNHESGTETNLPSVCSDKPNQSTLSAKYIKLPYNIAYSSYEDHSKYAVAYSDVKGQPAMPFVCIGDINRQSHQTHRGGGTMCFHDFEVHHTYENMIAETVPC